MQQGPAGAGPALLHCLTAFVLPLLLLQVENVKTNLLIQMEILGRWLATIVLLIALGAFLLAYLRCARAGMDA